MSAEAYTGAERLPTVAVVIPTGGGRAHLLERSLPRLLDDPATTELIVVLDREDRPTQQLLQRWREADSRVKMEPAGESTALGRGVGARDRGAQAATSQLVLSLDDDVVPDRDLVSGHARRHGSCSALVVLGYMPVVPPVQPRSAMGATARMYSANYERACAEFRGDPETVLQRLWAGHFSVPREAWMQASELPAPAAGYHGDADFGLRLRKTGLRGVFDPALKAQHFYRRSAEALAHDALSSGRGLWNLKQAHSDWRGARSDKARRLLRILLPAARSRMVWALTSRSLVALACLTDPYRLRPFADASVRLLWRAGVARGEHEAASGSSRSQRRAGQ